MVDIIFYLSLVFVGFIFSSKVIKDREKVLWIGKIQTVLIFLLIFTMGTRMGSNREIIDNLKTIGVSALVFTGIIFIFVVVFLYITRKLVGMNSLGELKSKNEEIKKVKTKTKFKLNKTTIYIVIAVFLGMLFGYFIILANVEAGSLFDGNIDRYDDLASLLIKIELSALLLLVGIDLGFSKDAFSNIKKVGFRVIIFPAIIMISTLIGGVVSGLILGMSIKEGLIVSGGFAWYSLAPGMIMDAGYITLSAISFLHNVLREMFAIILIPFVANRIGYIEAIGLPGAASMDVCLPVIDRATRPDVAIYGFVSGAIISFTVPILIPILLNL